MSYDDASDWEGYAQPLKVKRTVSIKLEGIPKITGLFRPKMGKYIKPETRHGEVTVIKEGDK